MPCMCAIRTYAYMYVCVFVCMYVCVYITVCLYSAQINVVKENRVYSMWKASNGGTVTGASGILRAKAKLNQLHQELADQGFSQVREGG